MRGGVKGRNNKGLITFDRKTKKDSYFVYKAYWSDEPMVHIASKRFRNRATDLITVKVYTNQEGVVELFNGNEKVSELPAAKVVEFKNVALHEGENEFKVKAGGQTDTAVFEKVAQPEESYVFVDSEPGGVTNWFDEQNLDDIDPDAAINPEFYSLEDTFGDILQNEEATIILSNGMSSIVNMNMKPAMLGMFATKKLADMGSMLNGFGGPADPKELAKKSSVHQRSASENQKVRHAKRLELMQRELWTNEELSFLRLENALCPALPCRYFVFAHGLWAGDSLCICASPRTCRQPHFHARQIVRETVHSANKLKMTAADTPGKRRNDSDQIYIQKGNFKHEI